MFITKCQECQLVKAKHQYPLGFLQLLPILEWKWEVISMDLITGLRNIQKQNDSIFVVVEKLSKAAQFIPVKLTYKEVHIADIFLKEIFRLQSIRNKFILDQKTKFTRNFWRSLFSGLETQLNFSTSYHQQTDGQIERVKQIVEDMLRMYVMNNCTKWEYYLHLVEFAYNNGYQTSAKKTYTLSFA